MSTGYAINKLKAELKEEREKSGKLLTALKQINRAYVNLLETGRDRITSLGGECDSVEYMEAHDPNLKSARDAVAEYLSDYI